MSRTARLGAFVVILASVATPSFAQSSGGGGLGSILLRFFSPSNPVVLREAAPPFSHAAHFVSQPAAQATLTSLNRGIAAQISTFPIGSGASGFTFTFDPTVGVFNRSTESFGPAFAERALTAGKKKFSFGINHVRATYDSLEGVDLDSGDITLYLTHLDTNNDRSNLAPWFEGDIIQSQLFLNLKSNTTVLFANYGVTDRLDLGIAVPFVHVDLDARIHASVLRQSTGTDPFIIHIFPDSTDSRDYIESGSADGIGDVVLRAKYNFLKKDNLGLALGADVRVPTGKEEDLLGTGGTQYKLYLAAQGPAKRFTPHANVGYAIGSGGSDVIGELPDEFDYTVGFDAAPHKRVTITADFIGRYVRDVDTLVQRDRTFQFTHRATPSVIESATRTESTTEVDNVNIQLGAAGVKVNPFKNLLVSANVLFKIGDHGLQDKLTPVFGIDYTF